MCRLRWNLRRGLGIYVGYKYVFLPRVLRDLEPNMGDQIMARYTDCMTNESDYPTSGGESNKLVKD